jgi:hypothetical protein
MIKLKLRISAINPILIILSLLIPVLAISQDAVVLQDHQQYRKEVVENMQKVMGKFPKRSDLKHSDILVIV